MAQAPPLADADQLAAFLSADSGVNTAAANLYLDIASGMVRDHLRQTITYVADDVVVLDPINGLTVMLPELPIRAITTIEILVDGAWVTCPPGAYTASMQTGIITALPRTSVAWPTTAYGVHWPATPGSWRVTYSHGHLTPPSALVGVVLGVAARGYSSPVGIQQERVGSYQVRYAVEAAGFSALELAAMARYVVPGVA